MILKRSAQLFSDWNAGGIRYCSFKSNEHLLEGLEGKTDLDILIDRSDYDKAVEILLKNSYVQFEPVNVGAYPNVVNWFGMDEETGTLIHIHLHFELMTGKALYKDYCLPWAELFLESAFLDEKTGLYLANPNQEYVLLCTRLVVKRARTPKHKKIGEDIVRELNYLKNFIDEQTFYATLEKMYGKTEGIGKEMLHIQELSNEEFIAYYHRVKKEMRKNQRTGEFSAFINSYANRVRRKLNRDSNRKFGTVRPLKKRAVNGGVSVAFVGIDGSGKSTVSKEMLKWISAEFDAVKYYAGAGDGKKDLVSAVALKAYKKMHSEKSNQGSQADETKVPGEKTGNPAPRLSLRKKVKGLGSSTAYLRILKSNIRHLKEAQKLTKEGLICLMDRYPQNSLPGMHDGAKLRKYDTGRGVLHNCVMKEQALLDKVKAYPFDLVLRFVVSPETSYARKPEEPLDSLKRKAETLKQVNYDAGRVVEINADEPLEQVILNVKREIWAALSMK